MAQEGEWKPNGRPQSYRQLSSLTRPKLKSFSTIARNFSASLHDVFDIDNNLGGLTASVEEKKKVVDSQTKELQELEAKLKETENRLKERNSRNSSPAGRASSGGSPHRRQPLADAFNGNEHNYSQPSRSSPLAPHTPQKSPLEHSSSSARSSQAGSVQYEAYRQTPTGFRKPVGQN